MDIFRTITSLDNRLNRMERLLDKLSSADTTTEASSAAVVHHVASTAGPSGTSSSTTSASGTVPSTPEYSSWNKSLDPVCLVDPDDLHAFTGEEENMLAGLADHFASMSLRPVHRRYIGQSSGFRLLQDTFSLKHGYSKNSLSNAKFGARIRPEFWSSNPWEDISSLELNFTYQFPPDDLMDSLINNYFFHVNNFLPLLHEPTFRQTVSDQVHIHDQAFANLLLLVCACGSRYSDDPRVLLDGYDSWHSAGWKYTRQLQARLATKSLLAPPTLYDMQSYAVSSIFYAASSSPEISWVVAGIGIRAGQDLGIHRRQVGAFGALTIETEQWRRAFWVLVALDRDASSTLGRPCAVQDDDFDLDMPAECDDEYWTSQDPEMVFKQPAGRPSKLAYFTWAIKLDQILAFTHRTIYSINKSKLMMGFVGKEWEQRVVAQLDSTLNEWVDSLPEHLRWDPHRENELFFLQSAYLYCNYYRLQILVHRPFIPKPGKPSVLPSLAICTNAARSYIHVIDVLRHRYRGPFLPCIYPGLFGACVVILFNIWAGKRSGVSVDPSKEMQEVRKGMLAVQQCEARWHIAGRLYDMLCQLADAGDVPLPDPRPPSQKKRSKDSHEDGGLGDSSRSEHYAESVSHGTSPSTNSVNPPLTDNDSYLESVALLMKSSDLPLHSDELARLPVHVDFDLLHYNVRPMATADSLSGLPYAGDAGTSSSGAAMAPVYANSNLGGTRTLYQTSSGDSNQLANGGHPPHLPLPSEVPPFNARSDASEHQFHTVAQDDIFNMWSTAPCGFGFDEWGNYITNVGESYISPE
ncbi:hypothetical protein OE88DRAFT_1737564 [Heliocybe sulcata]|uniref:Xylanolytic transcriptional activator regulatory domain-containing protein n=1 Tax=Heliocybe sulcata TaxID=5364 RepID=A0A5C3MXA5_9AGAM|nr:hypothetical protein OE88DRAFT_1737564 [Heliocybe sulcata]